MIKRFDFDKKKASTFKGIEPGGYVAKIHNAEILTYSWGEVLKISFDIAEGEFTGYYQKQYEGNNNEDRKWQGTIRVTIPDEGNQYYENQKKKFGNMIACIEESNPGYVWDWNEAGLKGKFVGLVFGNEEYSFNGYSGWKAKPQLFVSTDDIYSGNFRIPKDKPLAAEANVTPAVLVPISEEDAGELPF